MIHESFCLNRLLINEKRLIKRTQSPAGRLSLLVVGPRNFPQMWTFLGFYIDGTAFKGLVRINFHSIALIRLKEAFVTKENHRISLPHECATSKLTKKFSIRENRVNLPFSSFRYQFPCIPSNFGDCSKHERRETWNWLLIQNHVFAAWWRKEKSIFAFFSYFSCTFPFSQLRYVCTPCTGVGSPSVSKNCTRNTVSPVLWIHANFTFAMLLSCECMRANHLVPKKSYDFGISFFFVTITPNNLAFYFCSDFGYVCRRSCTLHRELLLPKSDFSIELVSTHQIESLTPPSIMQKNPPRQSVEIIVCGSRRKIRLQIAPSIALWAARHCNFHFNWITNRSP